MPSTPLRSLTGARTDCTVPLMSRPWLVMKFGGTSVATAENWGRIAAQVQARLPTHRVCVVASALAGVSNLLVAAIAEAVAGAAREAFPEIVRRHRALADGLGLSEDDRRPVEDLLDELGRLLEGIHLTREASPRLEARVMSFGELASTLLGRAALGRAGIDVVRLDARDLLTTRARPGDAPETRFLEAEVLPRRAPELVEARAGAADCVLTQGFIARGADGATCLLGRGGSDTSGSLIGALLGADRIEIWTDVHGMYTADPREIPAARLIRHIGYREAQELAAMGAKVLHPRAIGPARWANIPVSIRHTGAPDALGTVITGDAGDAPAVMAVVKRTGVTLVTVETLDMWGAHGFLARVFAPFTELGISVDLVATSQAAVSVTLDRLPGGVTGERFAALLERLGELGEVRVVHPTAVVSIVGRRIRTALHELGPAFAVFREHNVHLVSESSEDLNFSFVVDEPAASQLVDRLHARLVPAQGAEDLLGPSWARLERQERASAETLGPRWWRERQAELQRLGSGGEALYVYDASVVSAQARTLKASLPSLGALYYAAKANEHPDLLRVIADAGFGIECVSAAEIDHVRGLLGPDVPILFTPNFCPLSEYAAAYAAGAEVTLDGTHPIDEAPELFAGRAVAFRLDPGEGRGHHDKVRTAGAHAKFGQPIAEVHALARAAARVGARVIGLHAHVGSGILEPEAWLGTGRALAAAMEPFAELEWIDVGGGLGVVERPGQAPLPLHLVEESLVRLKASLPGHIELRMEPGRYLVSEAGVLLAPVTQVRSKGAVRFVGVATGMNSLLRPALYGAWHAIHNLSRLDEPPVGYAHVVGPICETGDVLGRDRLLPETRPGDILLIENCGAYGAVMASSYNRRPPAREVVLGPP